jgi:hypothetical protein
MKIQPIFDVSWKERPGMHAICSKRDLSRSGNQLQMSDFPIEPELHVRSGRGLTLRTIDEAAEFARRIAKERNNREWDGVLYRLEAVRTREDAREAADALRALLEAEDLLVMQTDRPR